MADLSILIPARNEMFLAKTIEDILQNIEADTEIIAVLDGSWADPGIPDHPRVKIIYNSKSVGQRAATNQAARISTAKYVMKVDAHCSFDKGFDRKLIEDMQDDWTIVPIMRNLHAFDWVCPNGHRRYQGPSGPCTDCGKETTRDVVWIGKKSPESTSFSFDPEPHFQYFGQYKRLQIGDLVESMSLQGSCFMMTREKYWELNICDEVTFPSWGSQGIEVACKTWLSGGKVIVSKKTWYAHMFRTQGGDFGFPYAQSQSKIDEAKKKAKEIFFGNKWPGAKYPLSWLIEKFWPVNKWTQKDLDDLKKMEGTPTKGIIFYTDNRLSLRIAHKVQAQLKSIGLPIVSSSLKPMTFGDNVVVSGERGYLTMFKQILAALEKLDTEVVFFCEHDVLYHPSHFQFTPKEKGVFYYNTNVWKVRSPDGHALWVDNCIQVSGLVGYREELIKHYKERFELIDKQGWDRNYGFEPGTPGKPFPTQYIQETWHSEYPNLDIRHDNNLTINRWTKDLWRDKKNCEGWTETTVDKIKGWEGIVL